MHTGGCLCGAVRYRVDGSIEEVAACHCHQCKQAQGSAFALNAPLSTDSFRFLSGEDYLQSYRHTPNKRRVFCKQCGSALFSQRDDKPEVIRLRLGTLDSPQLPAPHYHIHTDSAVDWCGFSDDQPRYPGDKSD
ncbi:MAG: GFA family protein [Granulosicoccaceae bacterium]